MNLFQKFNFMTAVMCLAFVGSNSFSEGSASDNTKINQRDQSSYELTADQQSLSSKDAELTRQIRREIMKEKNLSIYAQNVKIISTNGLVTLKGPVRSGEEQQRILRKAQNFAGPANVVDQMDIVPVKK
jgi:hyperosmotically inducible protein